MANSRNCLIAVDGSDDSEYALQWYGEHVHRKGDSTIVVFVPEQHGFPNASKWENTVYALKRDAPETMTDSEQDQIKTELLKFAQKLIQMGMEGKVRNIASKPEEGILRVAQEESADMIVVGSRRRGNLRKTFADSICDHLVHHSNCAVIICKQPQKGALEKSPEVKY